MAKIVVYDDDARAVRNRYSKMSCENDVRLIYLVDGGNEEEGRKKLRGGEVAEGLVEKTIVADKNMIYELAGGRTTTEDCGIPFPQDADKYFVDGLGYEGKGNEFGVCGFVQIASRLPKEKVTIISLDHHTCDHAKKFGYSVVEEYKSR